jgi:hypothetical protein
MPTIANKTLKTRVRTGNDSDICYTGHNKRQEYSKKLAIGHRTHLVKSSSQKHIYPSTITTN